MSFMAWELLMSSSKHDKTVLPTIVGKQMTETFREELAHTAIPTFDLLQGRVEIGLNLYGRVGVTGPSERNQDRKILYW